MIGVQVHKELGPSVRDFWFQLINPKSTKVVKRPPSPSSPGGLGGDFSAWPINVSILNGLIDALLCNIKCFIDVL